jgi:hypothetical protein
MECCNIHFVKHKKPMQLLKFSDLAVKANVLKHSVKDL